MFRLSRLGKNKLKKFENRCFKSLRHLLVPLCNGFKCCARACKTGYDSSKRATDKEIRSDKKLSVFRFPTRVDLRDNWIKFLHRDNFTLTTKSPILRITFYRLRHGY